MNNNYKYRPVTFYENQLFLININALAVLLMIAPTSKSFPRETQTLQEIPGFYILNRHKIVSYSRVQY